MSQVISYDAAGKAVQRIIIINTLFTSLRRHP